jgi:hypothetical protein
VFKNQLTIISKNAADGASQKTPPTAHLKKTPLTAHLKRAGTAHPGATVQQRGATSKQVQPRDRSAADMPLFSAETRLLHSGCNFRVIRDAIFLAPTGLPTV